MARVVSRERYLEATAEELPGSVDMLLIRLTEHRDFLLLAHESNGWYRAQFAQFEEKGRTPLQALCLAFLRSRGCEVI